MSSFGGYTLQQHLATAATLDKIRLGIWDFVVLQEQSQIPTIEHWRYTSMYPSARTLDSLILASGERTAFFMTWGWKFGGIMEYNGYYSPDFEDYFHMQDSVTAAYVMIADELNAVLAPVGEAWATAKRLDSLVDLWQPDNYHPTLKGSYLTSCVFYAKFFNANPIGLPYHAGLDPADALFLQEAAYRTVFGVDETGPLVPAGLELTAYPNPFHRATRISAGIRKQGLGISIYDISGRFIKTMVFNSSLNPNSQSLMWSGTDQNGQAVPPGVYFIQLNAGGQATTTKIIKLE